MAEQSDVSLAPSLHSSSSSDATASGLGASVDELRVGSSSIGALDASTASWDQGSAFVPRPEPAQLRPDGSSHRRDDPTTRAQSLRSVPSFDSPASFATTQDGTTDMLSDLELSRVLSAPATDHSGAEEGQAVEHNRSLLFPRIGLGVDEQQQPAEDVLRVVVVGGSAEQRKTVIDSLTGVRADQMRPEDLRDRISFYRSRLAGLFSLSLSATLESLLVHVLATSSASSLVDACVAVVDNDHAVAVASALSSAIVVIPVYISEILPAPEELVQPGELDAPSAFVLDRIDELAAILRRPTTLTFLRRRNALSFVTWRKSLDSLAASPSFPPATTAELSPGGPVSEVGESAHEGGMESSASFPPPAARSPRLSCRPQPIGAASVIMPNRHDPLNVSSLLRIGFKTVFEAIYTTVFQWSVAAAFFVAGTTLGWLGSTMGQRAVSRVWSALL